MTFYVHIPYNIQAGSFVEVDALDKFDALMQLRPTVMTEEEYLEAQPTSCIEMLAIIL